MARKRSISTHSKGYEFDGRRVGFRAGTVLVRRDRGSAYRLKLDGGEARLLTLLAVAYGQPVDPRILDHIHRAAKQRERGENCLAAIHLAFAGLAKLTDPREAARRLFIADGLIAGGVAPRDVLLAAGLDQTVSGLIEKWDVESELRVPRGAGLTSGRWTASLVSVLRAIPWAELGEFALFAARFTSPILAFGILFIPTPAGGDMYAGPIRGAPDLHYSLNADEGELRVTRRTADGVQVILHAHIGIGGIFYDEENRPVGRWLDNSLVIDADAIPNNNPNSKTRDDEPKLCPDPGEDKAGRNGDKDQNPKTMKDRDYEDYVKRLVNPENPTPRGFGYQLPNPGKDGAVVYYDDCHHATGTLIEAKGTGYQAMLAKRNGFMKGILSGQWIAQANRQVVASGGREIEWHFAECAAADYARTLFSTVDSLKRIRVICTPWDMS